LHALRTRTFLGIIVLFTLLLASCGAANTAPTPDIAVVVVTIQAQLTQDALNNPSATPLPTATPIPSATPVPATPTPAVTSTPVATNTPQIPFLKAKFVYSVTYPGNRTNYVPNEQIHFEAGFQNVGSLTWNQGYALRWVGGEKFTSRYEVRLGNAVPTGSKAVFDYDAFGSEQLGKHISYWQLYADSGVAVPGGSAYFSYISE
jgi:hypothetical protein